MAIIREYCAHYGWPMRTTRADLNGTYLTKPLFGQAVSYYSSSAVLSASQLVSSARADLKKINSFTTGITDPVGIQYIMIMSITAGGCLFCLVMAFSQFCAHSRWKKKQKKREQDAKGQRQDAESQDEYCEIEDEYAEAKCEDEKSPHRRPPQPASPPPSYNPRGQGKR